MLDLFADAEPWQEPLAPGAVILRRFALSRASALLTGIQDVAAVSPFRHMVTPGGYTMSVAMTNCGTAGMGQPSERGLCSMPRTIPSPASPGRPCLRFFRRSAMMPPSRPPIPIFNRMPVLSTAMALGRNSRCIRIKMNPICVRRSSRYPWVCPPYSSSADYAATILSSV